jgi:transposase
MCTGEIARTFAVSPSWARRVKQTLREHGRSTPLPRGGARLVKIDIARLAQLVREQPDATLVELRDRLGVACTESAISLALKRLDLTFKKRRCAPRSRIARMSLSDALGGGPNRPGVPDDA